MISERYPNVESVAVKCDVSKEEDIKNAVESAVKKWGRLDVMVSHRALSRKWEEDGRTNGKRSLRADLRFSGVRSLV